MTSNTPNQEQADWRAARLQAIQTLIQDRISFRDWQFKVAPVGDTLYVQVQFEDVDADTNILSQLQGRKWLLSPYMLDDEVVKTCYMAVMTALQHEAMESFKLDGQAPFHPHHSAFDMLNLPVEYRKENNPQPVHAPVSPAGGQFRVLSASGTKFKFVLKAPNSETILHSEIYESKAACERAIQAVKACAVDNDRYDHKTAASGSPYFNLKAGNGQIIGTSELYATEAARDRGIQTVKRYAPHAPVQDVRE